MILRALLLMAVGTLLFPYHAVAAQRAGVAAGVVGDSHVSGAERAELVQISSGMDLLLNDRVQSETDARMQILLMDETVLTIGPNSDLIIDKFIYDPGSQTGEMAVNLTKGALRYISGSIAHSNPKNVVIRTAAATIGVRGTAFFITDDPESENGSQFIGLLGPGANNDGNMKIGGLTVSNSNGVVDIFRAGYGTFVAPGKAPGPVVQTPLRLVLHIQRQMTENPRPRTQKADAGQDEGQPVRQGGGNPASSPPPAAGGERRTAAAGPPPASAHPQGGTAPAPSFNTSNMGRGGGPLPGPALANPAGMSGQAVAGTRISIAGVGDLLGSLGAANIAIQTASQDMIMGTQGDVPLHLEPTADSAFDSATLSPGTRTLQLTSTDALTGAVTTVMMTPTVTTTTMTPTVTPTTIIQPPGPALPPR